VAAIPCLTEAVGDAGESRAPTVGFVEPDQAMAYVPDTSPAHEGLAIMSPVGGAKGHRPQRR
jgi:hypothetical protein